MPPVRLAVPRRGPALGRRAALLLPVAALAGCGVFDKWFGTTKIPLPGRREEVMPSEHGLELPKGVRPSVVLPPGVANADWPQPGGNPAHLMGRLETGKILNQAWRAPIGEGGGFREKITAQPVVAAGRVFAMDSNAVVSAFDVRSGARAWRFATKARRDRSSNVGGGIAIDGGTLYAATGRGDVVAVDAASGKLRWRQQLGMPARSSPTIAEGRIYVVTIQQQIVALATQDGKKLWSHQATTAPTTVLGEPAPAYADGLVVAGFGSGDLLALRADSGALAWTDTITAVGGRGSLADISAITAMPVIQAERVFAIGQGGLLVAIDLHTGRRLWEREVAGSQTPWLAGDWMFIVTLEQRTAALSVADGEVAWVSSLPQWRDQKKQKNPIEWFGPVLAGERLVFASTDKSAFAINAYTGALLGTRKLRAPASLAPIVAGGTMYIVTADGSLTAYR